MKKDIFNLYINAAEYYDYDNRDNVTADIPFYMEYVNRSGNKVLELGCGTGRVTIPLAEAGYEVTGLDLSDSMLNVFEEKMRNMPEKVKDKIKLIKEDMSSFSLGKMYDLIIIPFRAFQSLTEESDINSCLACIRKHLSKDGLFIINVFRPYKLLDESWCYPETVQWETVDRDRGVKIIKKHWGNKIDVERQIIYPEFAYEILDAAGYIKRIEEKLSLKYYYYQQLKDYLTDEGLEVIEEYGWYDKSDIKNGRELIFICRKAV